jgi:SAM-dependent methyltransferase
VPNYDAAFFEYVNSGAVRSARRVLPLLLNGMSIGSVLDVGCGQGAWLSVWQKLGVEVAGIDGSYVDKKHLLIGESAFSAHDLSHSFALGRRFELVQSLEVAEHLPAQSAAEFVASLVRHGDVVLFSAAPRGQGGHDHINEQNYDYWRAHFANHDYVPLDYLRPLLIDDRDVEPWYRYNTLLYASPAGLERLSEKIVCSRIAQDRLIPDVSPPLYRIRKALTRLLPISTMTGIAQVKERLVSAMRAQR